MADVLFGVRILGYMLATVAVLTYVAVAAVLDGDVGPACVALYCTWLGFAFGRATHAGEASHG